MGLVLTWLAPSVTLQRLLRRDNEYLVQHVPRTATRDGSRWSVSQWDTMLLKQVSQSGDDRVGGKLFYICSLRSQLIC